MKGKKIYAKCIKPYEAVFEVGKRYRFTEDVPFAHTLYV